MWIQYSGNGFHLSFTHKTTRENVHTTWKKNFQYKRRQINNWAGGLVAFSRFFCTYDWHFSLLLIKTQLYTAGQHFTSFQSFALSSITFDFVNWRFYAFLVNTITKRKHKCYLKPQRIKMLVHIFFAIFFAFPSSVFPLREQKCFINKMEKYEKRSETFWENQPLQPMFNYCINYKF